MDYQKMTKDELIEKLQEQVHLAKAVEVKDNEVLKLTNQLAQQTATYKKELGELKSKIVDTEHLNKRLETLDREHQILIELLNSYVFLTRNLMKNIQGGLDNAVELENIISKNFKKGGNLNGK